MSEQVTRGRPATRWAPLAVTLGVSGLGVVLVVLATAYGWLGADVDRGAQFCERDHWCFFAQPSNTLSNLGFVVAGAALALRARHPSGRLEVRPLTVPFAVIVALLGPGSMAMHATESELGGHLDVLSMHLLAGFAAAYALARLRGWGAMRAAVLFAVLVALGTWTSLSGGAVPVLGHVGNLAFAGMLLLAVVGEVSLLRRTRAQPWWAVASLGALLVAFAIWLPSQSGGPWCIPQSWLQGHALWHLLCAAAAYLLGRHYTAAGTRD